MTQEELIAELHLSMQAAVGDKQFNVEGEEPYKPARDERGRFCKNPKPLVIQPIDAKYRRVQGIHKKSLCYWAAISKDGGIISHSSYSVCFADMGGWKKIPLGEIGVIGMRMNSEYNSYEQQDHIVIPYIHYILNDSPFADACISKNAEEVWHGKYAFFTPEVSGQILVSAMIALRMIWEYPYIPRTWYYLQQYGLHQDLAYAYSYGVSASNADKVVVAFSAAHSGRTPGFTEGAALNFVRHKPKDNYPSYNDKRYYSGMSSLYGPSGYGDGGFLMDTRYKAYEEAKQKGAGKINPFVNGNGQGNVYLPEFCEKWAALLNETWLPILEKEKENA